MWIGVAVIVLMSGEYVTDASSFKTEAECRAANKEITERFIAEPAALAYRLDCFDAEKYLTIKKVSVKPSGPSNEPGPALTDS